MNDEQKSKAQLIEELSELRRQLGAVPWEPAVAGRPDGTQSREGGDPGADRRRVERRLRDAVAQMQHSEDLQGIQSALEEGLRELRVPFVDCGINLVDSGSGRDVVSIRTHGPDRGWERQKGTGGAEALRQFWQGGALVYRRDLAVDDVYHERERVQVRVGHAVRSVVDVPFAYGTLAVNSDVPNAFSPEDLAVLQNLATVVEEAFRRREDLLRVEQRNRELEAEIVVRRQTDERLQQELRRAAVMGRIRDQVLALSGLPEMWAHVQREWVAELQELGLPIHRLSLQHRSPCAGIHAQRHMLLPGSDQNLPLSRCPWVGEAWQSRAPVVVDRARLEAADFPEREVQSLVEVPLPDGSGSLGVSSTVAQAFDEVAIRTLREFAGLLVLALRRLQDLEALRDSATRYGAILQTAMDGFWRVDTQGRLLQVNETYCRMSGYSEQELLAMRVGDLDVVETGAGVAAHIQKVMACGEDRFESKHRRRDGNIYDVEASIQYCPTEGGWFAGFLRDITARKRVEQEMIRVQRLHAVGELAAGISHNLNNILSGVIAPAQLIQRATRDPQILREVEDILASARHARDLVQRLGQSVRYQQEEELEPVPVEQVVHEAVQASRPCWQDEAQVKGISIEVAADLQPVPPVQGTRSGLHEVLLNMLLNAASALPRGGTVALRAWAEEQQVYLSVQDTGIGMEEEVRRRVFEPFFTTKAQVGTGLGLSTAYATVRGWGGDIQVASAPGQGTTFTLSLPVWRQAEGVAEKGEEAEVPAHRGRVLIVEDEPPVRALLGRLVSAEHAVEVAADGPQALARFAPGRYDAVLLDVAMPGMPGDEVAQELRRMDPAVVLVAVSGWPLARDEERWRVFEFHVKKPFAAEDILQAARRAVALHQARAKSG